ncbi:MAG TPA: VOC family protein [Thermoplasmata archaeon]|nr:VOC family protein [Thermoplasmata archaeon]
MATSGADSLQFYCVRLLVKDFARSWRFYRDLLGLIPRKGHGAPPYGEFVQKNRTVLSLFDRNLMAKAVGLPAGRSPAATLGRAALIFEVTDVDATARRLRRRGIRPLVEPTDHPDWGLRTLHLSDPEGHLIEIYSELRPG